MEKRYSFKVFRKTTRFKRYIIFPTLFRRKLDSKRKRKTNWLTLNIILVTWSRFYLKYRQFTRFYQSLKTFNIMAYSPNVGVLHKRSQGIDNAPINSLSLSRKLVKYFNSFNYNNNQLINPLKSSQYTAVLTQNTQLLKLGNYSSPSFIDHDSLLYENDYELIRVQKEVSILHLNSKFLQQTQNWLNSLYKIFILLILKNLYV
jgi:hypothetical protein